MSEFINNSQERQELLKKIIKSLHAGADLEMARAEFKKHFQEVSTEEITAMEQSLIKEGMPIEEVQNLCDVHAAVFEGSISDIHPTKDRTGIPGHPVQVFKEENRKLEKLIADEIEKYLDQEGPTAILMLRVGYDRLFEIDRHYARKEYLFFPNLEKNGIDGPPKVMWGVDDEIRAEIKEIQKELGSVEADIFATKSKIKENLRKIKDMITKEENILLPMLSETMSFYDWILVDSAAPEIGYFLGAPNVSWKKEEADKQATEVEETAGLVKFDAGSLTPDQVNAMLNTLPLDLTFVDHEGKVKYFTRGKERIFDRPITIIDRHVTMCHPPQSVHVVKKIIDSFISGEKDHEDFWIRMKDMFVYIRYFAVRGKNNEYLGTLEVTQNIKPITELEGEKRLVSD
ncbi:MAG: DUF438 domain-containing protein [Bacilli bacterium]|nr:DUF438 domain-containing protein [Bacilli bacterium]MBN2696153.1 DUF438 domain-containing protein [Bacilli bacterium]